MKLLKFVLSILIILVSVKTNSQELIESRFLLKSSISDTKMVHNKLSDLLILSDIDRNIVVNKIRTIRISTLYNVTVFGNVELDELKKIQTLSWVEYIEVDRQESGAFTASPNQMIPNDEFVNRQWYIENDGSFEGAQPGADIELSRAWEIERGSEDVIVAILDSGVKPGYLEFQGRIWENPGEIDDGIDNDNNGYVDDYRGWNFVADNKRINDDNGHGSFIAGVVGANSNNGIGYAGVDWNCRLMIVKVMDNKLQGFYSDWIAGIYYAVDHGADVINMSFGGDGYSQALEEAVNYAHSKGVVLVSSMLNDNREKIYYPAAFSNVIAVGATDPNDERSTDFVNTSGTGSNYGNHIDVVAPGNHIYGIYNRNLDFSNVFGGTSIATPMVTGIASLLIAQDPSRSNTEIENIIRATSDDQVGRSSEDIPGWDKYHGHGRVNAYRALTEEVEIPEEFGLTVYPNPASDAITISLGLESVENIDLMLIDTQGKIITKAFFPSTRIIQSELDVSNVSAGIYILKVTSSRFSESLRIVISR